MLELSEIRSGYGKGEVLHGVDLTVGVGEAVSLLGPNGAGKSTLLQTIAGLVRVTSGTIVWDGHRLRGHSAVRAVADGIVLVPEGRQIFQSMTVHENLLMGAFARGRDQAIGPDIERMYDFFPVLRDKRHDLGSAMSGGQQQMLAIARGLMARPRLLMLDEPSLGLAPVVVESLIPLLTSIVGDFGTSLLVVEQNAELALAVSTRSYLLQSGNIAFSTTSEEMAVLLAHDNVYLGGVPTSDRST